MSISALPRASGRILPRVLLLLLILSCPATATMPLPALPPSAPTPAPEKQPSPEQQLPGLTDLISRSTTLPRRLIDLDNDMRHMVDVRLLLERRLPAITRQVDTLAWQITLAKSDPNLRFDHLASLDARLHKLNNDLDRLMQPVTDTIGRLAAWNREWSSIRENIHTWQERIRNNPTLGLAAGHLDRIRKTIETALAQIQERLKPTLEAAARIGELQTRAYAMGVDLQVLIDEVRATGIEQTAPSMLSSAFYRQINSRSWQETFHNITLLLTQQRKSVAAHGWDLAAALLIILLLIAAIGRSRHLVSPSARWAPFSRRPVATGLFISLSLLELVLFFRGSSLPAGWSGIVQIIVVLAVIRLTGILVSDRWTRRFLRQILAFLALTLFLKLIRLPHPLIQLYIFYVSALGVIYLLWKSFRREKRKNLLATAWFLRLNALLPAIILVAELNGYDEVARFMFSSFLLTVVAVLVLWMLFVISTSTAELLFSTVPVPILRRNAPVMVRQLTPVFAFLFSFLLLIFGLVIWHLYPTPEAAFLGLKSLGFSMGSLQITLPLVLSAAGVIYTALLASRWLQALLRQEILPRYHADIGVQLSITRLVHYAVLLIGFLVLLRLLGFELTKLTILGGALGVGIGFGLQAIVNNFASGLILLFERPIKVGDMIQVGADMGEVKKLGLRATVVQTLDNAEIVVPNSDLITGQVTNWTLAERRIRVKVPVGVAYGSDIQKVLEILLACAEDNPLVLTRPRARALFLAFGPSSLDFELRVWISDFSNRRQVLSELNQEIESEFRSAGIEIPFPQQDIHLRSIDEPARRALQDMGQE